MKVSGFTFIRNAIKYDYPIKEAILSILPICDEFIVAVGKSNDATRELIANINSNKIKIIDTIWDDSKRNGGEVLAIETDKALNQVNIQSDWAFYIQGDEILHEKYIETVTNAMKMYKNDKNIEGLLFKYLHFYANYDYVADSRKWYRKEIRIIRPNIGINAYRDAQGFRLKGNKLNVKEINAYIYHYGWVKSPENTMKKNKYFQKLWHNDNEVQNWINKNKINENKSGTNSEKFDYSNIDSLKLFTETHPKVMKERINSKNWEINLNINVKKLSFRNKLLHFIEKYTNYRLFEYKNYKKI